MKSPRLLVITHLLSMLLAGSAALAQESLVKAYVQSAEKTTDVKKKTELLRMAIQEAESLKKPELMSGPLLAMGKLELSKGNGAEAKEYFDRAVAVNPNESGKALMNSITGNAYRAVDQLSNALPYYKAAVSIREKNDPPGSPSAHILVQTLKDLANCLRDLGNLTAAEPIYEQAISIMESNPEKYHLATSLEGLARLRLIQGDTATAVSLARQALAIFEEKNNPVWKGTCLGTIARAKEKAGENEAALAIYKQAIAAYDSAPGKASELPAVAELLEESAKLLQASGDKSEADKHRARAQQIRDKQKEQ